MVELKGSLSGIGLPALLQLIGELHHSGHLELSRPSSRADLGFDDGQLVSASFGEVRGVRALELCTRQLADADFRFIEGTFTGERTIDIPSAELQRYLSQVPRGERTAEPVDGASGAVEEPAGLGPCPVLGFADDAVRHYSRPTALHRCYAAGAASLVTGQEQRELCLSGRYPACPRFRTASNPLATAAQAERPPSAPPAPVAPPTVLDIPTRPMPAAQSGPPAPPISPARPMPPAEPGPPTPPGTPTRPAPFAPSAPAVPPTGSPPSTPSPPPTRAAPPLPPVPPTRLMPPASPAPPGPVAPPTGRPRLVPTPPPPISPSAPGRAPAPPVRLQPVPPQPPAGVVTRLKAAAQMQLAGDAPPSDSGPGQLGDEDARDGPWRITSSRRNLLLLAIGAVLGLLVLAALLMVAVPALEGRLAQRQSGANSQAVEPVPTVARAPIAATAPADSSTAAGRTAVVPTGVVLPAGAPSASGAATLAPRPTDAPAAVLTSSQPTLPPTPTLPTPEAQPTASNVGESLVDVVFASGPSPTWVDNPPLATWSDGAYRLASSQIPDFVAVGVPVDRPLGDVVVSATFRKTGGPAGGGYGLVVRDQGPEPRDGTNQSMNAYVMETGDRGEFGVWRRDGDHWVDLVPWTRSPVVRVGGSPNDLTVRAIGARLSFTVNGTEVANVEDDTFPMGGVGVFVGGDDNEVALDHFAVQIPN